MTGFGQKFFVAFETLRHTYMLGECDLPGSPEMKMTALNQWYGQAIGRRGVAARILLCKKQCIKLGDIEVSIPSPPIAPSRSSLDLVKEANIADS